MGMEWRAVGEEGLWDMLNTVLDSCNAEENNF